MQMAKRKPKRNDAKKGRLELEKEAMQSIGSAQRAGFKGPVINGLDPAGTRIRNLLNLRQKGYDAATIGEALKLSPERVVELLASVDATNSQIPPAPIGRPRLDPLTKKPSARVDQKRYN